MNQLAVNALDRDRAPVRVDVVGTARDEGIVIDAQVQVGVTGTQAAEINARRPVMRGGR